MGRKEGRKGARLSAAGAASGAAKGVRCSVRLRRGSCCGGARDARLPLLPLTYDSFLGVFGAVVVNKAKDGKGVVCVKHLEGLEEPVPEHPSQTHAAQRAPNRRGRHRRCGPRAECRRSCRPMQRGRPRERLHEGGGGGLLVHGEEAVRDVRRACQRLPLAAEVERPPSKGRKATDGVCPVGFGFERPEAAAEKEEGKGGGGGSVRMWV